MSNFIKLISLLTTYLFFVACEQKKKEEDTVVTAPKSDVTTEEDITPASWLSTKYKDPFEKTIELNATAIAEGGPSEPLSMTYVQANAPVALFLAGGSGDDGLTAPVPFLAFTGDHLAKVTVRHIKSLNGQNVSSQLVVPIECPEAYSVANAQPENMTLMCVPLINAVVPGFLLPTDNSGSYVHEFSISIKNGNRAPSVLQTKIASKVIIPGQNIEIVTSNELKALSLAERLTMATNDLVGSPRRDFRAFTANGSVAPGVQTEWVLTFTDIAMTINQDVFFELPVTPGSNPAKPVVARGSSFMKRSVSINSLDHFRIRIENGNGEKEFYAISATTGLTTVSFPIKDGSAPLRVHFVPDFGSDFATRSFSEYVKPFAPTFCPKELLAFKPEEWRQARSNTGYVACDGTSRTRIVDLADSIKRGISTPVETFFGSFSYLPRMGGTILGGTNGVLTTRLNLSGKMKVSVRNPQDPSTLTDVGEASLDYTFQMPTAATELDKTIKSGKGTPGMDTIYAAILRKGMAEPARRDNGTKPGFPFQGHDDDNVMH